MKRTPKKRKLLVASVIPPHVTTASMANLAKVYRHIAKNHPVEITVFVDDALDASFPGLKVKRIKGIDSRFGVHKALFFLGLPRLYYPTLARDLEGFDVIESSTPEFYLYAYQSYAAAKKYGSRLVLRTSQTIHDFFLYPYTKFLSLPLAKKACGFASFLCFTNPESRDAYVRLGLIRKDAQNVIILGHGVDESVFKPMKTRRDPSKKILLSVGALLPLKGHQNAIEALSALKERGHKNLELWIVGKGEYQASLEKLAAELGLESEVRFLGAMTHSELAKTYNKADVFVLANLHDVTPAVSEAMLCNIPVVASRCGGVDFVIPSDDIGIITKYDDPQDLSLGIEKVIGERNLRKRLIRNARAFILKNFTIAKVAERLYTAYTK